MTDRIHELKTWPHHYEAIANGDKQFELRRDDRDFEAGDLLHLREFDPDANTYTRREMVCEVTYLLCGPDPSGGLNDGWAILSITDTGIDPADLYEEADPYP